MTLKDRKLSAVVRYRTNTSQIWQATEFKSEGKSHQTIMDRPYIKGNDACRPSPSHVSHHHLQLHVSVTTACSHCPVTIAKEVSGGVNWHQQTASQSSLGPRRQLGLCGHSAALRCLGVAESWMT